MNFIEVLIPEAVKLDPQTEHTDGDPFINKAEELISASHSAMDAGIALLASLHKEIRQ